jgi:hypothetical protein
MLDYKNLLEQLEAAGFTWAAIENQVHVSSATLCKIRKGEPVSLSTIQKLADLLEKTLHVEVKPDSSPSKKNR